MLSMSQQPTYGPHNPHPLSTLRTELVWEGKYDEYGQRREVDIAGCAMPMQRIESIDEPRRAAAATGQLELFEQQNPKQDDFRNRLIWGDNKLVMASLLQEFKGKVDLIYIDPPFDVGADFTLDVEIGEAREAINKDQSILEMVAYRDIWGKGADSYLQMMYERLVLTKELLTERGSIYVHCDWRVDRHLSLILEEIFGQENYINCIQWQRTYTTGSSKAISQKYPVNMDTILYFRKGRDFIFNKPFKPYSEGTIKRYDKVDKNGKRYKWENLKSVSKDRLEELLAAGLAKFNPGAKYPVYKQYLDEDKGTPVDSLWSDLSHSGTFGDDKLGYATQKPEVLLERIIQASSNEGDLVADFFCVRQGTRVWRVSPPSPP